jgi:lipopolysaccharide transport system ATP-binding protein
VSKSYRLGVIGSGTLREDLQSWWHRKRGLPDPNLRLDQTHLAVDGQTLWALHDISLEVEQGEVLGIIGRNGAGKSTLLKILSRVTAPTSGRIRVKGRVASLLEVGTGFHPELTGRENIFLNGAILGMTKAEVARKFDEIVAFSEIEQFIDTPVKRYSSGMYVRLAFAVAAHLDPEILVVDEVLAVGDAAFQKKCLGKMGDVAGEGRTVLFVSHNMTSISTLCPRSLLLSQGRVELDGPSTDVIDQYFKSIAKMPSTARRAGDDFAGFVSAQVVDGKGYPTKSVDINEPFTIEMTYEIKKETNGVVVPNYHFYTTSGICCFVINAPNLKQMLPGRYVARCEVPGNIMNEGSFIIDVAVTSYLEDRYIVNFWERALLMITVRDPKTPDEFIYGGVHTYPGILRPRFKWQVQQIY